VGSSLMKSARLLQIASWPMTAQRSCCSLGAARTRSTPLSLRRPTQHPRDTGPGRPGRALAGQAERVVLMTGSWTLVCRAGMEELPMLLVVDCYGPCAPCRQGIELLGPGDEQLGASEELLQKR
jgi:hypothetical protein